MVADAQRHQELQSMEALLRMPGYYDYRSSVKAEILCTLAGKPISHTSIAVAAMVSVPRGPTISGLSLAGYIDSIKQTCSSSSSRRYGKCKAKDDLGFEGFQMECRSARKNVMAHKQDLRAKLLKHKGIHNVKTNIKSQIVLIEGTIESEKIVTYMHKRAHKPAVEFEEKIKVEAKGKDGDALYFVHYVYAHELFTFE
nr:hypothetical protein [Tanacetum cinerariifolium]